MNTSTNTTFLKEMGITEWTVRDEQQSGALNQSVPVNDPVDTALPESSSLGTWWFFGSKPSGDSALLFQNIIRALGLHSHDWSWKTSSEKPSPLEISQIDGPLVAIAFGGPVAQQLSGERDSLAELRETVLGFNLEGAEEIPLIATFDLNHILSRPKEKALLWQDLLLAKSVLQSL